ncbi:MAG: methyltransferase domain-containing protein [Betaproteobacteria bacterium]|nr:methyltransferase domain-containing protein [Betaproteobacteria bacterium]
MPCAAQSFPSAEELDKDKGAKLTVCQCSSCGLVQIPGLPVPYFREVIRATAFSPEMRTFRQAQFSEWVEGYQLAGKRVLEVGCGRGEYLTLLQELPLQVHGIEYSANAIAACRAAGLPTSRAFIARSGQVLKAGSFDAFLTLNFMEHWPDPVASLRGIGDNLVDSAIGLVEVPNFDMILTQGLYSEFISDHLSYFTRETLIYTLQSAGFEVLKCESIWHDYILSAVVKKRAPVNMTLLASRRQTVATALHRFIDQFPDTGVAIWGAGHQALATIALAEIGHKIKYVVDSAPFKQGRFTPATHLPVVPPAALETNPVSAVVVMAAAYSDEVYGIIRAKHGPELKVAILRDFGLEICA